MVKRAAEGLTIRYGEGAAKLEGANLAQFMTALNEYLAFFDKVDKRIRDETVTELLPRLDLSSVPTLKARRKTRRRKSRSWKRKSTSWRKNASSRVWDLLSTRNTISGTSASLTRRARSDMINWELVSSPESRQLTAKFKQIEEIHGAAVCCRSCRQGPEDAAADIAKRNAKTWKSRQET